MKGVVKLVTGKWLLNVVLLWNETLYSLKKNIQPLKMQIALKIREKVHTS